MAELWADTPPGVPLFINVTLLPALRAEPNRIYPNVGQSTADPNVVVPPEGWHALAEYRDVVLHKPYFRKYLPATETAYTKPQVIVPLTPIEPIEGT